MNRDTQTAAIMSAGMKLLRDNFLAFSRRKSSFLISPEMILITQNGVKICGRI
jgi:hypothetical protein